MSKTHAVGRRTIFRAILSLPWLAVCMPAAIAGTRTPKATEGPFYPTRSMRFADVDNNLVRIVGAVRDAGGEIVTLRGRVLDRDRAPIEGAHVEIWQCDVNGRYLHDGDDRAVPRDPSFQGFGRTVTDSSGAYSFRTIKPVSYPGRTPHIHVKVLWGGQELTTQFYIAQHSQNPRDGLYRRMTKSQRDAVGMRFRETADGLETTVDIII